MLKNTEPDKRATCNNIGLLWLLFTQYQTKTGYFTGSLSASNITKKVNILSKSEIRGINTAMSPRDSSSTTSRQERVNTILRSLRQRTGCFVTSHLSSKMIPARTNILALEDSVVLLIDKRGARHEMALNPTWEGIGRVLAEIGYMQKEDKEWEFLCLDATERYKKLCKSRPGIIRNSANQILQALLGSAMSASVEFAALWFQRNENRDFVYFYLTPGQAAAANIKFVVPATTTSGQF